ncbi:cyclic nucleotide-binding domain-containing protein 1 isoform X2 [Pantherophis guttatus]|uniref:Cyclic nucleotide-binding domain-containing protein 1 isoform X2 n=1 Tax=Pantherophis guttatus TaxID=94885 RepID=A0ABM3YNI0_PANGU|nr:cyclic nucleotide-binding domain-containing protein 1 isoform X2 [Pantherophis guttatus]
MHSRSLPFPLVRVRETELEIRENLCSTEEAHQKFMKIYPKIFIKKKPILPGIPEKRTIGVHSCNFCTNAVTAEDFHNIHFYLNKMKNPDRFQPSFPKSRESVQNLIKILKKIPILRTEEEHEAVYKIMKVIPDINEQLSEEQIKEISKVVLREYWVKESTVDASQGFYIILRGSVKPQTKYYKRLIGGHFISVPPQVTSVTNESNPTEVASSDMFGVGCCFGTLVPLPLKKKHDVLTVLTEENCDFIKIPSINYLRVKEDIAKHEQQAKEEVIRGSPFYQNWPMIFIFKLTAQLKWRKFPTDYVFMEEGEISKYVGFIKSGHGNAYRIIPALVKRPLGKMAKQMRQVFIGQLHRHQSFGETSVLLQTPSTYTLKAATPVELGVINATDVLALDPVIQMLLLQIIQPSFENITFEDLKYKYINNKKEMEWRHKKEVILQETLFYNGIRPGLGKWLHTHFEK